MIRSSDPTDIPHVVLDLKKLKALRLQHGLSMDDAARAAGLASRGSWYEIESGRKANITLETLYKIAHALQVNPRDLLK
ncbi:MAG: helix-turn-helix transcriptional regulator [Phycisphaerales bacterium]|nr:helix-turn-helix transcriptional regulator [Phycisphaerales bacterium]